MLDDTNNLKYYNKKLDEPLAKYYTKKSKIHGTGLFAHIDFAKGQLVGTFKGRLTNQKEGKYILWVHDGSEYKAYRISCDLKYANHSKVQTLKLLGLKCMLLKISKKTMR